VISRRRPGPAPAADFTSALVLGLGHPSGTLSWNTLSTGTPAALRPSPTARRVARAFAALAGCERAVALTSTLHAFSDLFGCTWRPPAGIFHDEAVYPIARWGMERAERHAARIVSFRHLSTASLEQALERARPHRAPPWIVTDGLCAGCGRAAPLDAYAALARRWGGIVLVDDAQAIGLYGRAPDASAPYGHGGGGSLARLGVAGDPTIVVVASLAKAFGAPLALVAGARDFIDGFAGASETLVHCSPPAEPVLAAALRALTLEGAVADARRARLADRVRRLRAALRARGFVVRGGLFPMQRVPLRDAATARALHARLIRQGVRAVVRRARCNDELSLTFVVTATHDDAQIARAADALERAARDLPRAAAAEDEPCASRELSSRVSPSHVSSSRSFPSNLEA
jgi:8-amino-7-oxononanoate synthase